MTPLPRGRCGKPVRREAVLWQRTRNVSALLSALPVLGMQPLLDSTHIQRGAPGKDLMQEMQVRTVSLRAEAPYGSWLI